MYAYKLHLQLLRLFDKGQFVNANFREKKLTCVNKVNITVKNIFFPEDRPVQ